MKQIRINNEPILDSAQRYSRPVEIPVFSAARGGVVDGLQSPRWAAPFNIVLTQVVLNRSLYNNQTSLSTTIEVVKSSAFGEFVVTRLVAYTDDTRAIKYLDYKNDVHLNPLEELFVRVVSAGSAETLSIQIFGEYE